MAATSKMILRAVLSVPVVVHGLQHVKNTDAVDWNPLDIFRSSAEVPEVKEDVTDHPHVVDAALKHFDDTIDAAWNSSDDVKDLLDRNHVLNGTKSRTPDAAKPKHEKNLIAKKNAAGGMKNATAATDEIDEAITSLDAAVDHLDDATTAAQQDHVKDKQAPYKKKPINITHMKANSSNSKKDDTNATTNDTGVEFDFTGKPRGDPTAPRMLVSLGCDGSAAVLKHAHYILHRHGIETPVAWSEHGGQQWMNETLAENYSKYQKFDSAMGRLHKDMIKANQSMVLRGSFGKHDEKLSSQGILKLGTKLVVAVRRNLLDQAVCMVKDCFDQSMGHPVMNGSSSDLCMKRRQENSKDYKAFLNVNSLTKNLGNYIEKIHNGSSDLHAMGYEFETVSTEDLLDFEWSKDMVMTALPAWRKLLKSWGVRPHKKTITQYLKHNAGTRSPILSHEETIYNFDAVKDAVKNNEGFVAMLRSHPSYGELLFRA